MCERLYFEFWYGVELTDPISLLLCIMFYLWNVFFLFFFFQIDVKYISVIEDKRNWDKSCSRKDSKRKRKTETYENVSIWKKGEIFYKLSFWSFIILLFIFWLWTNFGKLFCITFTYQKMLFIIVINILCNFAIIFCLFRFFIILGWFRNN